MKHHYVPVFFQKHFAGSDGLMWVYDRLLKTSKQLHPLSTCCQHDLYAVKMPGSEFEQVVEMEFLRKVDGSASFALKKLPSVLAAPGPELLGEIVFFAALQHTRVPANKKMITTMYEAGANDFMEVALRPCHSTVAAQFDGAHCQPFNWNKCSEWNKSNRLTSRKERRLVGAVGIETTST